MNFHIRSILHHTAAAMLLITMTLSISCVKEDKGRPTIVKFQSCRKDHIATKNRPSVDPPDAIRISLNAHTDIDGTAYHGIFYDSFSFDEVYLIDNDIDLSSCRIDSNYAEWVGPKSFKWTAPTGKYALVVKPAHSIVYMFRIKGQGGDYEGWTPSAGGGTDKTVRNKRAMFMVGTGFGVCESFCRDADWNVKNPATLNHNGKVDGCNQPVFLNLNSTDYSQSGQNTFSAIVKFSRDNPAEFGMSGCAECVWPINFGSANTIFVDSSIEVELGEKRDLGNFQITIPTLRILKADHEAYYKISIYNTRTGIDVIWADLRIEKF